MEIVVKPLITKTAGACGGRACIAGHRIRVQDIVVLHEMHGKSPAEIVAEYPGITLANVQAALTYYRENRQEIEEEFRKSNDWAEWVQANIRSKIHSEVAHDRSSSNSGTSLTITSRILDRRVRLKLHRFGELAERRIHELMVKCRCFDSHPTTDPLDRENFHRKHLKRRPYKLLKARFPGSHQVVIAAHFESRSQLLWIIPCRYNLLVNAELGTGEIAPRDRNSFPKGIKLEQEWLQRGELPVVKQSGAWRSVRS